MTTATTIIKDSYRGWTIAEEEYDGPGKLICYPKDQGIQHDVDVDGDSHRYCGNCLWFNDLAEAEAGIDDDIIMTQEKELEVLRNIDNKIEVQKQEIEILRDKLKIAVQCIEANKEEFAYRLARGDEKSLTVFAHHVQLCANAIKAIQE